MSFSVTSSRKQTKRKGENTPIEFYQTLEIMNAFSLQTVQFLNQFATTCESKLHKVTNDLQRLEITLHLLESKLRSIDGLDQKMKEWESGIVTTTTTSNNVPTNTTNNQNIPPPPSSFGSGNVPPPPTMGGNIPPPPNMNNTSSSVPPPPSISNVPPPSTTTVTTPNVAEEQSDILTCEKDPRLANYFRLFYKVRVPRVQIEHTMRNEGLDPSILDTPNAPSPLGPLPVEEEAHGEEEDSASDYSG
ncbi:hypothetical protein ABK040_004309 [Willaertia magna]